MTHGTKNYAALTT